MMGAHQLKDPIFKDNRRGSWKSHTTDSSGKLFHSQTSREYFGDQSDLHRDTHANRPHDVLHGKSIRAVGSIRHDHHEL
jgi:hypothetical protein